MLIEFSVKNFRSIKELETFSLAKASGCELEDHNTFLPDAPGCTHLLKSAAIYGSNSAGKSNLIKAFKALESIVLSSSSLNEGHLIEDVVPFLFDKDTRNEPTEFEVHFISEGIRYQYGFVLTSKRIYEEWLIAYPKGKPQRWFSRVMDPETEKSSYKFVDLFTGQKSVWKKATRENALFLSTAVQLNSEQLKPVYNWFSTVFRPTNFDSIGSAFTTSLCAEEKSKNKVLDFFKSADFDIHDISLENRKFDPSQLPDDLPQSFRDTIIENMKDDVMTEVKTIHKTSEGELVPLNLDDESDGTKKFFNYAGPWIDTLNNGYVLIIDEIHNNLHPRLVRFLVDVFNSKETNPNNAQLIFTTHETSILSQEVFRRDQVWFCEKREDQSTSIYSLTDFKPRKGTENIEQGYLSGRYGAYPFINEFCLNKEG